MPRPSPLPRRLGDTFSVAEATSEGVSRRRTRARDLSTPFRGVRATAVPTTHAEWCAAYVPRLRDGQCFSHLSAAILWNFPLDRELRCDVHVGALAPSLPPRARGVVGHQLPATSVVRIRRGLPLLDAAETWSYLGTALTHEQLVVTGDYLVRRKYALATLEGLRAACSVRGRPGIRAVRRALADVREKTDSPRETMLRLAIVAAGLPEPVIGFAVTTPWGDFIGTPDLVYVRERIAIEYEGKQHFTDPDVYADDIARYELMEQAGWLVIRVIARDLGYRRAVLIARIERALAARSTS